MNCPNCGAPNREGVGYCQHCGTPLAQSQPQQNYQQPYQPNQNNQPYTNPYATQYNQPYQPPQNSLANDKYNGHPMGWYKFMIYFSLCAGAELNLICGIITMTGAHYGTYKNMVYTYVKSLKTIDLIFGIVFILIAAYAIITRFQLSGLKKSGPPMLYSLYIIGMIVNIAYVVAVAAAVSKFSIKFTQVTSISSLASSLTVSAVFLVINIIYFGKRKDIFVN